MGLSPDEIVSFINDGYVKIENAFSSQLASECRLLLWKATGCDPNDPATWREPVIRIGEMKQEPFKRAANTPALQQAFDQLAGKGNWEPRDTIGSFPIRFPSTTSAGDTGWHVDASFPGKDTTDYMDWRINIHSKGRALLMLFLFSDVAEQDAPTLIRAGSHAAVARTLYPEGEKGLSFLELAKRAEHLSDYKVVKATGMAGTVYLCHPFIVHAAQDHHGQQPRFMAQPPLIPKHEFNISRPSSLLCPIEKAILQAVE